MNTLNTTITPLVLAEYLTWLRLMADTSWNVNDFTPFMENIYYCDAGIFDQTYFSIEDIMYIKDEAIVNTLFTTLHDDMDYVYNFIHEIKIKMCSIISNMSIMKRRFQNNKNSDDLGTLYKLPDNVLDMISNFIVL